MTQLTRGIYLKNIEAMEIGMLIGFLLLLSALYLFIFGRWIFRKFRKRYQFLDHMDIGR